MLQEVEPGVMQHRGTPAGAPEVAVAAVERVEMRHLLRLTVLQYRGARLHSP